MMEVRCIDKRDEKKKIIEKCDSVFPRSLVENDSYIEIFDKIDKFAIFIGAYEQGRIIGYVALYANDTKSYIAYITMIGVIVEMQGRHIGSALMKKSIEVANRNNMKYIRLEVLNTNKKAISFYKYHGFVFEKECSEDSIYMIKELR